jgi:isopropylmalate/homocitrate/citramalate synthase
MDMLYMEKGIHMRIDAAMPQAQRINEMAVQPQKEVAGENEHDGDADDAVKAAAVKPSASSQINPQGVGNKVDLFA